MVAKSDKNPLSTSDVPTIVVYDFNEEDPVSDVIPRLFNHQVDGFLLKNALAELDIECLLDFFSKFLKEQKKLNTAISTFPKSFLMHLYEGELPADYFRNTGMAREMIRNETGIDISALFIKKLSKLNRGVDLSTQKIHSMKGEFESFEFRSLDNKQTGIRPHCENSHLIWHSQVNEQLGRERVRPGSLAFFFTLQEAQGGEITLFNVRWKDNQYTKRLPNGEDLIIDGERIWNCSSIEQTPQVSIHTEPGDLFIFNGAEIWHTVQPVTGEKSRITLGAFIQRDEMNRLVIWN